MNSLQFDPEMMKSAIELITSAALRALFVSHPNPGALREAWNEMISLTWRNAASSGVMPPGMKDTLRYVQESMEYYLPPA